MGARPWREASLRGELEALRRDSGAGPEAGEEKDIKQAIITSLFVIFTS